MWFNECKRVKCIFEGNCIEDNLLTIQRAHRKYKKIPSPPPQSHKNIIIQIQ